MTRPIAAIDALALATRGEHALIDVRAEGEFAQGAVPGFFNLPILTDAERHEVGKTYKVQGQDAALQVGHTLTEPHKSARIAGWSAAVAASSASEGLVTCWRGGLRSALACEALSAHGVHVRQIEGGYKAMRQALAATLPYAPGFVVLSGLTGSGKTRLICDPALKAVIDLEGLARHRGSSFGGSLTEPQPSQATFENAVGLQLMQSVRPLLVEDESAAIGRVTMPALLRDSLSNAPVVYVDVDIDTRAANCFDDYVAQPLAVGFPKADLLRTLRRSLMGINRRLGGELTTRLDHELTLAFGAEDAPPPTLDSLAEWIKTLLRSYYDPTYDYGFKRRPRDVIFRGNYEECRQWILQRFG